MPPNTEWAVPWECRRPLHWHATTRLWLSLEPFTNAGLTQEEMAEVIERLSPNHYRPRFRTENMGFNGNLIVEIDHCDSDAAASVVDYIQYHLLRRLKSKSTQE